MDLVQIKRLAADVMKVGVNKVKIMKPEEATTAMTKDDVRILVMKKIIVKRPDSPASRGRARKKEAQKKKGRQKGRGRKRGAVGARIDKKKEWMKKVRALRREMAALKDKVTDGSFRKLYNMISGGYFRSKTHLKLYITEKKLWKTERKAAVKKE